VLATTFHFYGQELGQIPTLADIWWAILLVPLLWGALTTLSAGGATLGKRVIGAALCGVTTGILFSAATLTLAGWTATPIEIVAGTVWVVFILTVLSPIGAVVTEVSLPEPR
jgi:hypothetical protein